MRWEYTVLTRVRAGFFRTNGQQIPPGTNALNTLGDEGWELVSVREDAGEVVHYFKRPVEIAAPTASAAPETPPVTHCDWALLHGWLCAQWRDQYRRDGNEPSYHGGLFEGRADTAHILAALPLEMPAEQKLAALARHLDKTLRRTESPEEEQE